MIQLKDAPLRGAAHLINRLDGISVLQAVASVEDIGSGRLVLAVRDDRLDSFISLPFRANGDPTKLIVSVTEESKPERAGFRILLIAWRCRDRYCDKAANVFLNELMNALSYSVAAEKEVLSADGFHGWSFKLEP